MQTCPGCGIKNELTRRNCFKCGGELPEYAGGTPPGQQSWQGGYSQYGAQQPPPVPAPPPAHLAQSQSPQYFGQSLYPGLAPAASDVDEAYLDGFSWGPGCTFYYWSRALIYFWLGILGLNALTGIVEAGTANDDVITNPGSAIAAGFMGLLIIIAAFAILIYVGKIARRRRWEMLTWRSFEQFRAEENQWNVAGMIGWALTIIIMIMSFLAGLSGTA